MGLPNINITFTEAAASAPARAQKGIVAVVLRDSASTVQGAHTFASVAEIPAELAESNRNYLEAAFIGNDNKPKKVLCYVVADTAENLNSATQWLATQKFSWLVAPAEGKAEDISELATFVEEQRKNKRFYKAVLPNSDSDSEAIVNFTTNNIVSDGVTHSAAGFCSRIAGLIAGTPLTSSVTYAKLPEVTEVEPLTQQAMDTAIDDGELILLHDGNKVKVGRGVTSLVTTTTTPKQYKKIKIVETVDLISEDLKTLCEDNYIGKFSNSYDNKVLLITAIKAYFEMLEREGVLRAGASTVAIDIDATTAYLRDNGFDVTEMTEAEMREADTGDNVFLTASIGVLDAIEDIDLKIAI